MHIKFVKVCYSEGSLGKNKGCFRGPDAIVGSKGNEIKFDDLEKSSGDFFVGGDHSITYPLFKGFVSKNKGKKIGLVVFDAHVDCADYIKPPSHEDWLRVLIQDKIISPSNVFIIGVRRVYSCEKKFLKGKNINLYRSSVLQGKIKSFIGLLRERLQDYDKIYLSVDIDVLNPLIAPGTGYLHKGGFSFSELKKLLLVVKKTGKIGCIDLVEVNPLKDVNGKTIKLAKEIVDVLK